MKKTTLLFAAALTAAIVFTGCPAEDTGDGETPVAGDFNVSGLSQVYDGLNIIGKSASIAPKAGKSTGIITIYYADAGLLGALYSKNPIPPSTKGTYDVTFDVRAAAGWKEAKGLSAGKMIIDDQIANPQAPAAGDFDIGNLTQTAGKVTPVTIVAKSGKSQGKITNVKYDNGVVGGVVSTIVPQTYGSYVVTFDIDAAVGWNAATGLNAGTLTIPVAP